MQEWAQHHDGEGGLREGGPAVASAEAGETGEELGGTQQQQNQQEQQQHQEQQDEEADGFRGPDEDEIEGGEGGAPGGFKKTPEQQGVLNEYFISKSNEFLMSEAYLEGWTRRDLIEYFYDQYLQQDMTPADALASAASYVENPEAYGLVGGQPPEEEAATSQIATATEAIETTTGNIPGAAEATTEAADRSTGDVAAAAATDISAAGTEAVTESTAATTADGACPLVQVVPAGEAKKAGGTSPAVPASPHEQQQQG